MTPRRTREAPATHAGGAGAARLAAAGDTRPRTNRDNARPQERGDATTPWTPRWLPRTVGPQTSPMTRRSAAGWRSTVARVDRSDTERGGVER